MQDPELERRLVAVYDAPLEHGKRRTLRPPEPKASPHGESVAIRCRLRSTTRKRRHARNMAKIGKGGNGWSRRLSPECSENKWGWKWCPLGRHMMQAAPES